MVGTLAPFDAIAHERQQGCVLLLRRTEKRTDMTVATKRRTSKGDRFTRGRHDTFLLSDRQTQSGRFLPGSSPICRPEQGCVIRALTRSTKPSACIPGDYVTSLEDLSTFSGGDFVAARSALTSSGAITRKKHLLLDFPGLEKMKINWIGAALVFLRLTQVFKGKDHSTPA